MIKFDAQGNPVKVEEKEQKKVEMCQRCGVNEVEIKNTRVAGDICLKCYTKII